MKSNILGNASLTLQLNHYDYSEDTFYLAGTTRQERLISGAARRAISIVTFKYTYEINDTSKLYKLLVVTLQYGPTRICKEESVAHVNVKS